MEEEVPPPPLVVSPMTPTSQSSPFLTPKSQRSPMASPQTPESRRSFAPPTSTPITLGGDQCKLWHWKCSGRIRGVVVIIHGLGSHARFPTVAIAAEAVAAGGYSVIAPDLPGHGESEGLRGFIYSADMLEEAGLAVVRAAREMHPKEPVFLLGSSMGGAICVRCALALAVAHIDIAGLVLLAPMLAPSASPPARLLLGALSYTPLCRLALIPSSATSNSAQYADPAVLTLIDEDPLAYKGSLRIGSAAAVLDLGSRCESTLESIRCPFLCMLAEREQVLGPMARAAAERMYEHAATPPSMRCLKRYDALHGLLCEPEPLRSLIVGDILAWLGERANARGVGRLRPMSREVSTRALAAEAAQLV